MIGVRNISADLRPVHPAALRLAGIIQHAGGQFQFGFRKRVGRGRRVALDRAEPERGGGDVRGDTGLLGRVVDLAQLIESLKQDVAKLRGLIEVLANQTETLERRQKDLYVDLDNRLRRLEQTQSQLQDKLSQGERSAAAEKQAYETALNQFKLGNYQLAITSFQNFMTNFSSSELVPSAQYWIGNAYYAMRDYKSAIAAQQKVVRLWPENSKAPDALLNIASSQSELGESPAARETLRALVKRYPSSPAAEQAKQRLVQKK